MERKLREKLKGGRFENVSPERSRLMGRIRGKNTRSTEVRLRMAFVRQGVRGWKLHIADLPGKPDFFFRSKNLAVFVDGCFWHGCPRCGHVPKTNNAFWAAKIQRNKQRDRTKTRALKKLGYRTIRVWEHSLKSSMAIEKVIVRVRKALNESSP